MFLAASLRYFEKVVYRFLARLSKFAESIEPKPDAGVNYAELMEVHTSFKDCSAIPTDFKLSSTLDKTPGAAEVAELGRVEILRAAYRLFLEFQGLFVNSVYSYAQRDSVRDYFLRRKAEDAFTICQVELNLAYDVFYTKAILTHQFKYSPLVNLVSLTLQLATLFFWIRIDKHNFHHTSVVATYFLVGGSIAHVLLSLLMHFTSDWCLVKLSKHGNETRPEGFQSLLSSIYNHRLLLSAAAGTKRSDIPWANSIPRCNLLSRMVDIDRHNFSVYRTDLLSRGLRDIIFKELVIRSQSAQPHAAEESCSDRVMWVLALLSRKHQALDKLQKTFDPWISEVDYEESLILWHIATTLCYHTAAGLERNDRDLRNFSKILSDYMLYLLIHNPDMMPPSAGVPALIIYRDTWSEGSRFCWRVLKTPLVKVYRWQLRSEKQLEACQKILQVDTHIIPPRQIRDDQSKALLFDACALAKKLQELKAHQWEIISQVLLEMLFYSAAYSSPAQHLEKLKSGGDLITLVWLLMAHLGLGNHFRSKKRRDKTAAFVINKHT